MADSRGEAVKAEGTTKAERSAQGVTAALEGAAWLPCGEEIGVGQVSRSETR